MATQLERALGGKWNLFKCYIDSGLAKTRHTKWPKNRRNDDKFILLFIISQCFLATDQIDVAKVPRDRFGFDLKRGFWWFFAINSNQQRSQSDPPLGHISNADHLDAGGRSLRIPMSDTKGICPHTKCGLLCKFNMHRNRIEIFTVPPILVLYLVGGVI